MSLGFGVGLLFAPSAHAQAESSPDHFTETGVEVGPGGNSAATVAHSAVLKPAQTAKPAVAKSAAAKSNAAPVQVAVAVADRNRPAVTPAPKR
jgi:hypothetical protein